MLLTVESQQPAASFNHLKNDLFTRSFLALTFRIFPSFQDVSLHGANPTTVYYFQGFRENQTVFRPFRRLSVGGKEEKRLVADFADAPEQDLFVGFPKPPLGCLGGKSVGAAPAGFPAPGAVKLSDLEGLLSAPKPRFQEIPKVLSHDQERPGVVFQDF
ncbi:MAG: hypothetical protein Q7J69_04750 [Candidatus Omnitrophota bacterium]|nr:hypothetical protein [Candidatus Omnitrophota bacterium]